MTETSNVRAKYNLAINETTGIPSLEDQAYALLLERVEEQEKRIQEYRGMLNNRESGEESFGAIYSDFTDEYPQKRKYVSQEGTQYKKPRLRTSLIIGSGQWVEIQSSLPFTDDDRLTLASRLNGIVEWNRQKQEAKK
jgi:hypothetical protein